jgi:uncharacterized protein with FMN-binding domain
MGRFDEPNMGLPILGTVPYELLLLGYIILQMAQRKKKWNPERTKVAIEATRNRKMGSYKASRVFNIPQTKIECYVKDGRKAQVKQLKHNLVGSKFFLVKQKMTWLSTVF